MSDRKEPMAIQTIIATMRAACIHLNMADRDNPKLHAIDRVVAARLQQAADDLATHLVAGIEETMSTLSGPRTVL